MDSIERKKTKPYNINEKEILDIVAAKGSYLSSISENLEEVPPHKESSSRAESKKTITDEEVKNNGYCFYCIGIVIVGKGNSTYLIESVHKFIKGNPFRPRTIYQITKIPG